jgi:hypothetical protein
LKATNSEIERNLMRTKNTKVGKAKLGAFIRRINRRNRQMKKGYHFRRWPLNIWNHMILEDWYFAPTLGLPAEYHVDRQGRRRDTRPLFEERFLLFPLIIREQFLVLDKERSGIYLAIWGGRPRMHLFGRDSERLSRAIERRTGHGRSERLLLHTEFWHRSHLRKGHEQSSRN